MIDWIKENDEVYYAPASRALVSAETITFLKMQAQKTARGRCRLCAHPSVDSSLHEMLIVHKGGAYIRPHRHIGKAESLHVIEGEADLIFFDKNGNVEKRRLVGTPDSGNPFYARTEEGQDHMLLLLSPWFVYHEVTSGPFDRNQTVFPAWAPEDGDLAAVGAFLAKLRTP